MWCQVGDPGDQVGDPGCQVGDPGLFPETCCVEISACLIRAGLAPVCLYVCVCVCVCVCVNLMKASRCIFICEGLELINGSIIDRERERERKREGKRERIIWDCLQYCQKRTVPTKITHEAIRTYVHLQGSLAS